VWQEVRERREEREKKIVLLEVTFLDRAKRVSIHKEKEERRVR